MSDMADLQAYIETIHQLIRGLPERVVDLSLRTVTREQIDLLKKFDAQIGSLNVAREHIEVLMVELNTIAEERRELRTTLFSGLAAIRADMAKLSAGQAQIRADIDALQAHVLPDYTAEERRAIIKRFEQLELRLKVVLPPEETQEPAS